MLKGVLISVSCLLFATISCSSAELQYELGFGDRLRVSVYQWEALSGTYAVGVTGQVSMPLLGDVPAAGLDTAQLADKINGLLQAKLKLADRPSASVEIVQFRPFFLYGDVEKSGEYPFRPGMIVLDALAMGGGLYRPAGSEFMQLRRDAIVSRGDVTTLGATLDALLVRRARLQAEVDATPTFNLPPELTQRATDPVIAKLMTEEHLIIATRLHAVEQQTTALEALIVLLEQEITTRQSQVTAIKEELAGLSSQVKNVRELVGRGVATVSRQSDLDITVADIKRSQLEIETAILRSRQSISDAEQKKVALVDDQHRNALTELHETNLQIANSQQRIDVAQRLVAQAEIYGPQAQREMMQGDERNEPTIRIVRREAGVAKEIAATQMDRVQPGDVVKVYQRVGSQDY